MKLIKSSLVWKLIDDLNQKKGIGEILINGPTQIFVEKEGALIPIVSRFTESDIELFIAEVSQFNGANINHNNPVLDGLLPDGSRINIIVKPNVCNHSAIAIRKYNPEIKEFYEGVFGLDSWWIKFFKSMVYSKKNILICGQTSSGKTTLINLMLSEIGKEDRIITIEDTRELVTDRPNVVNLLSPLSGVLSSRDLIKNSLRMRPDRLIFGEVRSGEMWDLLQMMNTGHRGVLTSLHASSCRDSIARMENLSLLSGLDLSLSAIRRQIANSFHFIVFLGLNERRERVVLEVSEITGIENETVLMQNIGLRDKNQLIRSQLTPTRAHDLIFDGHLPQDFFSI